MREVVCIFVQWDCLDRAVRDFPSTENTKQRRVALLLPGAARVLLLLWCTHRHWMSCGALPGMQKCPGDLLSPRGSNTGVPRAAPDGIAEGQPPGRPCGQLQQDQPEQGGGTGREGCKLCVTIPSLPSWGCPREVPQRCERCCRVQAGSKALLLPPAPVPPKAQPQTWAAAKPSRWRAIKMCCAYNADLFVCSRQRNEYSEVAGKGVCPVTMHIHLCTNQYLLMDSPWGSNPDVSLWVKSEEFVD